MDFGEAAAGLFRVVACVGDAFGDDVTLLDTVAAGELPELALVTVAGMDGLLNPTDLWRSTGVLESSMDRRVFISPMKDCPERGSKTATQEHATERRGF